MLYFWEDIKYRIPVFCSNMYIYKYKLLLICCIIYNISHIAKKNNHTSTSIQKNKLKMKCMRECLELVNKLQ